MKKLILVFAAVSFISVTALTQNATEVPSKVKTAFDQKFKGTQKEKWGKENANEWEAEFTMNNKEYSANFSAEGTWLETEYKISEKEIPVAVIKTLSKEFPGYKLLESEVSETGKGKVFEFEVQTGKTKMEISVNTDGTLIKKEPVKEKGEEKD